MPKPPEKPKGAGGKAPAKAPPAGKAPQAKGAGPAKGAPPTKGAPAKGAPAGKGGPAKAGGGKGPAKPAVAPANTPTEEPIEEKSIYHPIYFSWKILENLTVFFSMTARRKITVLVMTIFQTLCRAVSVGESLQRTGLQHTRWDIGTIKRLFFRIPHHMR